MAESRGSRWEIYVCKPLASLGFLGAATATGAGGSLYGRVTLAMLILSWIGAPPLRRGAALPGGQRPLGVS